jgi:hypothetical protein
VACGSATLSMSKGRLFHSYTLYPVPFTRGRMAAYTMTNLRI